MLVNRHAGQARPVAAAVFSAMIDTTLSSRSLKTRADRDPILSRETVQMAVQFYLGVGDPSDPRVNALSGDFSGLPPIRIDVGDEEVLLDDALQFHEHAERSGQACDVHVWKGMMHVFPASVATLEAATEALNDVASFLRQELGRTAAPLPV
ncbi:alpha/beta hydrolase fold domain-containing protein [Nitratireductor sp. GCM10026969]|uniref:alpha/beta hydrolase fold domain-containing protein n=1 Tax=Nitratireductor sp. GCM10026969 TaxID=3252645 RepID=UPI0036144B1B